MSTPRPRSFDYDEAGRSLIIVWDDETQESIPFSDLRLACPCATCHGEMGVPGRFSTSKELRPGEDELADLSLVGAYGLNVIWQDGHNTGIYTYPVLYDLAPHEPVTKEILHHD
ncbi:MAG: gamma-butyrobetaine hydroxylase-like domain-containing protein [Candidatus Dormibacteria bacterium]